MDISKLARRTLLFAGFASLAAAGPLPGVIPVETAGNRCIVPVYLNGRLARMVLDTGAECSVLTRAAVARLRLPFDSWVATTLRGAGGMLETHVNADAATATLGGTKLFQRPHQSGLSLAVTNLSLGGADGLLGADILRHVNLDLDFPAACLRLHAAPSGTIVPLRLLWPDLLLTPVTLDGQNLTALIDTGATISLINARGLHRLGLTPAQLAPDTGTTSGTIGGTLPVRLHRFNTLRLGVLTLPAPELLTASVPEPAFDLVLGLDILGQQRFMLSYSMLTLGFS